MSIVNYCVPASEAHLKAFETAQHKNQKPLIKETMTVRNEHNLSTNKFTWTLRWSCFFIIHLLSW